MKLAQALHSVNLFFTLDEYCRNFKMVAVIPAIKKLLENSLHSCFHVCWWRVWGTEFGTKHHVLNCGWLAASPGKYTITSWFTTRATAVFVEEVM